MSITFKIILTYLVLILQTTLVTNLSIAGTVPNIALILVVFLCLSSDFIQSVSFGFWIGLGMDAMSPGNFGANALAMTLLTFLTFKINQKLFINDILSRILLLCFAVFTYHVVYLVVIKRTELIEFPPLFLSQGLPAVLYTSMIGIIFILLHFYRKKHV